MSFPSELKCISFVACSLICLCFYESVLLTIDICVMCTSIEARPPALHMARQVQGRLTPCWVHLLGDRGCMH